MNKSWIVVGRVHGADEDTSLVFDAPSRHSAIEQFVDSMAEDIPTDALADLELQSGACKGVYVTHVAVSDSPITLD